LDGLRQTLLMGRVENEQKYCVFDEQRFFIFHIAYVEQRKHRETSERLQGEIID
jgi:hypothetical protein